MANYQEFLDKLLDKELNRMRLMIYKRKRRPFLDNKVTIHVADKSIEDNVSGYYIFAEEQKEHQIYINQKEISRYIYGERFKLYHPILKTIRHELTHAYVYEKFKDISKIEGIHRDCSKVFIDCLCYFECGTSSHPSNIAFNRKYERGFHIFDGWDWESKMLPHLLKLIDGYNKETEKLNYVIVDNKYLSFCNYKFGNGDCSGLEAQQKFTTIVNRESIGSLMVDSLDFYIGSCVYPEELEKYTKRKIRNGMFKSKYIGGDISADKQSKYINLKLKNLFI
jgi:hypothetical protein